MVPLLRLSNEVVEAKVRARVFEDLVYIVETAASIVISGETFRPRPDALVANYVRDFEHRLARKPGRMLSEARHHPLSFVLHYLPRGLVSKPREVLAEWETLVRLNQDAGREHRRPVSPV